MKKKRLLCCFLIAGIIMCLLNACQHAEIKGSANSEANLKPDAAIQGEVIKPLKIAVFGQKVFTTRDGKVYEEIQGPSCKMGPHTVSHDFVYTELIEAFSEEADVPVEIIYGANFYQEDLKADLYILDTTRNSPASIMTEEYCYDLMPFFERNAIYDNGLYVEPILKVGEIDGKQFIFPLTFNMNIVMSSEESLVRNGLDIEKGISIEKLTNELIGVWHGVLPAEDRQIPLLNQTNRKWGKSIEAYRFLAEAGGICYNEDDTEKILFDQLLAATKEFLCADLAVSESELTQICHLHDELKMQLANNSRSTQMMEILNASSLSDCAQKIGCFASGAGESAYYPFATQVLFYENAYREIGESFFCTGLPMQETSDAFRAAVITYGFIPRHSKQPENAFKLLQYLAEAKRPCYYDMSVYRESISETFSELNTTNLEVENIELGSNQQLNPLSEENREYLEYLVEHISEAYFPGMSFNERIFDIMQRYFAGSIGSSEEVYGRIVSEKRLWESMR